MAIEPCRYTGSILVEPDSLGSTSLGDGDECEDKGQEEDGQLSELHDDYGICVRRFVSGR